eukprot:3776786-Prorocentrum_lima.AAC.1
MDLSMVLSQIWGTSLPVTEKKRLCRAATQAALGIAKAEPMDPVAQVQEVLDMLREKVGNKLHPGEATRWLRQQGQQGK